MVNYLLDTNHCIYLLNGTSKKPPYFSSQESKMIEAVRRAPSDSIFISEVTLGELYLGAFKSQHREKNLKKIYHLRLIVVVVPVDENVWKLFGKTKATLQKQGKIIDDLDLLIACTAEIKGFVLVTNDKAFRNLSSPFLMENWAE